MLKKMNKNGVQKSELDPKFNHNNNKLYRIKNIWFEGG